MSVLTKPQGGVSEYIKFKCKPVQVMVYDKAEGKDVPVDSNAVSGNLHSVYLDKFEGKHGVNRTLKMVLEDQDGSLSQVAMNLNHATAKVINRLANVDNLQGAAIYMSLGEEKGEDRETYANIYLTVDGVAPKWKYKGDTLKKIDSPEKWEKIFEQFVASKFTAARPESQNEPEPAEDDDLPF